jgi:hypothetical protein
MRLSLLMCGDTSPHGTPMMLSFRDFSHMTQGQGKLIWTSTRVEYEKFG